MIYLIMPVGSDPDFIAKRAVLERLLSVAGAVGHFPLARERSGSTAADRAVAEMKTARVVIGDLALERPSCYFEVGLAQGAGVEVSLIAPEGTQLHQVEGRERVAFYQGMDGYEALMRTLIQPW